MMEDADDEKRTLIFNVLANLPQDVLMDIYKGMTGGFEDDAQGQYILDVIFELQPELKERKEQNDVWGFMSTESNLRIYAKFTHKRRDPLTYELGDAYSWWGKQPTEVRRQAIQMARERGWFVG